MAPISRLVHFSDLAFIALFVFLTRFLISIQVFFRNVSNTTCYFFILSAAGRCYSNRALRMQPNSPILDGVTLPRESNLGSIVDSLSLCTSFERHRIRDALIDCFQSSLRKRALLLDGPALANTAQLDTIAELTAEILEDEALTDAEFVRVFNTTLKLTDILACDIKVDNMSKYFTHICQHTISSRLNGTAKGIGDHLHSIFSSYKKRRSLLRGFGRTYPETSLQDSRTTSFIANLDEQINSFLAVHHFPFLNLVSLSRNLGVPVQPSSMIIQECSGIGSTLSAKRRRLLDDVDIDIDTNIVENSFPNPRRRADNISNVSTSSNATQTTINITGSMVDSTPSEPFLSSPPSSSLASNILRDRAVVGAFSSIRDRSVKRLEDEYNSLQEHIKAEEALAQRIESSSRESFSNNSLAKQDTNIKADPSSSPEQDLLYDSTIILHSKLCRESLEYLTSQIFGPQLLAFVQNHKANSPDLWSAPRISTITNDNCEIDDMCDVKNKENIPVADAHRRQVTRETHSRDSIIKPLPLFESHSDNQSNSKPHNSFRSPETCTSAPTRSIPSFDSHEEQTHKLHDLIGDSVNPSWVSLLYSQA